MTKQELDQAREFAKQALSSICVAMKGACSPTEVAKTAWGIGIAMVTYESDLLNPVKEKTWDPVLTLKEKNYIEAGNKVAAVKSLRQRSQLAVGGTLLTLKEACQIVDDWIKINGPV